MKTKQKLRLKMRPCQKPRAWWPALATFALAAWLSGGCTSPVLNPVSAPGAEQGMRLQLQMEEPDTKVSVNDASGKCTWTPSDSMPDTIAVWVSGTGANKYVSCVVEKDNISSSDATVGSIVLPLGDGQSRSRYAVYPASAAVTAASGSDDGSVNPQVTYNTHYDLSQLEASLLAEYTRLPMVAKNGDNLTPTLAFCHVGGMLRLSLKGIPSGATVAVSFEGMEHVTGTYEVLDAGTTGGRTKGTPVSGKGKTVHIKLPAAVSGSCVVNVPLPCGDYGTLTGVRVKAGTQERVKYAAWPFITHAMGKKLECDFNTPVGPIDRLELGAGPDATLWKGQKVTRQARAYDANGNEVTGVSVAWSSGNTAVATVNPSTGEVTAANAGQAVITATASGKTASYTVYVNEILSVELSRTSIAIREGQRAAITAEVDYTHNGDWESISPKVTWSSSDPAVATTSYTATLSGERNSVSGLSVGEATITASFDASVYGSGTPSATCAVTVSPKDPVYLPGKFTVNEYGKSVYFASGNVVVTATFATTNDNNPTDVSWKIAEHQWDLDPARTNTVGTQTMGEFRWGTANNGTLYDGHVVVPWAKSGSTVPPRSGGKWGTDNLPTDIVIENTWRGSSMEKILEWGIHFDDKGNEEDVTGKTTASWYTLSAYEWDYLLEKRHAAKALRGFATLYVAGDPANGIEDKEVKGLIILPDGWTAPGGVSFNPATRQLEPVSYEDNIYFTSASGDANSSWDIMEASGAVFLPAKQRTSSNWTACYWASSATNYGVYALAAHDMDGYSGNPPSLSSTFALSITTQDSACVRLVHD